MSDEYDPVYDPEKNTAHRGKLPPYNVNFNPDIEHTYMISELRIMTSVQIRERHAERAQLLADTAEPFFGKPQVITQSKGTGDLLQYEGFRLYYSQQWEKWVADFPCGLVFSEALGVDPNILLKKVQKWRNSCASWDRKLDRRAEAFRSRILHRWPSEKWEFNRGRVHRNDSSVFEAISAPFKFGGCELVMTAAVATLHFPSRTIAEIEFNGTHWIGRISRSDYDSHEYQGPLKAIVRNMVRNIEDTRQVWSRVQLPEVK